MSDNVCGDVIVVRNEDILDENGNESEAVGQAFIASIGLEGTWMQTSYNGSFRGRYAGPGMKYDPELDEFVTPTIEE
jgi:hypothetical protein